MRLDDDVKRLLAAGDADAAATQVIRGLGPAVIGYLRPMLRDEDRAQDAHSQWAERVWAGLPGFRWSCSLRAWCFRLAYHVALNLRDEAHARRVRRFRTGEASGIAQAVASSTAPRLEQRRQELVALRRELSPEEQTLLFLRVDQELPWADVAEILSEAGPKVSPEAAEKRYGRLRERLARLARARGLV